MKPVNKILFPTDFSEHAKNAFRHALLFTDQIGAQILVIHTIQPISEGLDYHQGVLSITRAQMDAAKVKMKEFVDHGITQVLQELDNAPFLDSNIEIGPVSSRIIQVAQREDVQLIIMGAQGEHNALERLLGTVSEGVVEGATCPVMLIPLEVSPKPVRRIVYATDFDNADPFEIWKATKVLQAEEIILRLVHIDDQKKAYEGEKKLEVLKAFFEEHPLALQTTFHFLPGQNLADALDEFINQYDIDLLVMYQPKRAFMTNLFHRSQTKKMAAKTSIPLLVMKN